MKFVVQIHLPIEPTKHTSHVCQVILENKEIRMVIHIYLSFTNAKGWDVSHHGPKPILPKIYVLSRSRKHERKYLILNGHQSLQTTCKSTLSKMLISQIWWRIGTHCFMKNATSSICMFHLNNLGNVAMLHSFVLFANA